MYTRIMPGLYRFLMVSNVPSEGGGQRTCLGIVRHTDLGLHPSTRICKSRTWDKSFHHVGPLFTCRQNRDNYYAFCGKPGIKWEAASEVPHKQPLQCCRIASPVCHPLGVRGTLPLVLTHEGCCFTLSLSCGSFEGRARLGPVLYL